MLPTEAEGVEDSPRRRAVDEFARTVTMGLSMFWELMSTGNAMAFARHQDLDGSPP